MFRGTKTFLMAVTFLIFVGCTHARITQLPNNQYEIISEISTSLVFPKTEYAESMMKDQAKTICPNYEIIEFKKVNLSWLHGRTYYKWIIKCSEKAK